MFGHILEFQGGQTDRHKWNNHFELLKSHLQY